MISFELPFVDEHFSGEIRITSRRDGQPYCGKSGTNRFDDPKREYGVCYAARDIRCSITETLLHNEHPVDGAFLVEHEAIARLWVHRLESKEPVFRVDFSGHLIKRLGIQPSRIMSEERFDHAQELSRLIYEHNESIDCIQYVSRQNNEIKAIALFDRSVARRGVRSVDCTSLARYPEIESISGRDECFCNLGW